MKLPVIMGAGFCMLAFTGFSVYGAAPSHALNKPLITATTQKINLNTASLFQLSHAVKGIGKRRAAAIVAYRTQHHGFQSIEELANVPKIGKRFVETHASVLQDTFTLSAPLSTNKPGG